MKKKIEITYFIIQRINEILYKINFEINNIKT
jgi:hypothetical protein